MVMNMKGKVPVVFIAVMGVTGAGKSSFIRLAAGRDDIVVKHKLNSCTSEVATYSFDHGPTKVVLVDTPGFNDTIYSETAVLKEIANWLAMTYREPPHIKLSGIVYLQSISDSRLFGSTLRNLKMFRQLCGEQPLKNVVLATTFWGKENFQKAQIREEQLRTDPMLWEPMIKKGSRLARVTDQESALQIISSIVKMGPVTLAIQDELIHQNKNLEDTSAGKTVNEELERLSKMHAAEMAKLRDKMKEAVAKHDVELQESLAAATETHEHAMEKVLRDQESLRYERHSEQRHHQQELMETHQMISAVGALSQQEREEDRREYEIRLRAQEVEDEMKFEAIVAKLLENEGKVREEERVYLQEQIRLANQQPSSSGRGTDLLVSLGQVVGNVAMTALGFPMILATHSAESLTFATNWADLRLSLATLSEG